VTSNEVSAVISRVRQAVTEERVTDAWAEMRTLEPLLDTEHEVAWAWAALIGMHRPENAHEELRRLASKWSHDPQIAASVAEEMIAPADGRAADEEIEEDDPCLEAIALLDGAIARLSPLQARDPKFGGAIWNSLGNALRLAGPRYDQRAEAAYRAALAIDDRGSWRFNLGLLYKHRGRWSEGVALYRELAEEDSSEPVMWNLAICATAARMGEVAVEAWRTLKFDARLGEDGLPFVPKLGAVKVRLTSGDLRNPYGPRDHEHVWVAPRSPCHGTVQNATMYEVDVDAGDVIVWDGAPIGWVDAEETIPRFAILEKLSTGDLRTFRFRARLGKNTKTMKELSRELPGEMVLYSFGEQVRHVCRSCISKPGSAHTKDHETVRDTVVAGKLVIEASRSPEDAFDRVARLTADTPGLVIALPDLAKAAGKKSDAKRHAALWSDLDALD
jgi:hypothetical protein